MAADASSGEALPAPSAGEAVANLYSTLHTKWFIFHSAQKSEWVGQDTALTPANCLQSQKLGRWAASGGTSISKFHKATSTAALQSPSESFAVLNNCSTRNLVNAYQFSSYQLRSLHLKNEISYSGLEN